MPPFDDNGNLPSGIYDLRWLDFEEKFAINEHRRRLTLGLKRALILLAQAGCQLVYVGGSFVTSKEYPNDFDAWYDDMPISFGTLDPIFDDRDALKVEIERVNSSLVHPFNSYRRIKMVMPEVL